MQVAQPSGERWVVADNLAYRERGDAAHVLIYVTRHLIE